MPSLTPLQGIAALILLGIMCVAYAAIFTLFRKHGGDRA